MGKRLHHFSDGDLIFLARNAASRMASEPSSYGTTLAEITSFISEIDALDADTAAQALALSVAKASTSRKNASRGIVLKRLRKHRNVAKAFGTPEAKIVATGIPIGLNPVPSNSTVPFAQVDTSERLRHTIHFQDAEHRDTKRKPRGVVGIEFFVKLGGDMPGDNKDCDYLGFAIQTPFMHDYEGKDVGKTAHYMFRWRMRDGKVSGWAETVSATITG